jgi:phenylacetate-coenzyme A ligase PaaK-like adenylate-forming protein
MSLEAAAQKAREALDEQTRQMVQLHFHPTDGAPFWLEKAKTYDFNPLKDVNCFDDLKKFPLFEDDWLRGGPVRRFLPQKWWNKPTYVFETGGTTGIPKSRCVVDDFRIDYEMFSETLPEESFPRGSNWLMLGPSGPRRLRLAIEHLCQYRGGICFCIDLDPRWVVKLLKKGDIEGAKAYSAHCIDQALTILSANHDIKCMFTTPKLLEALALRLMDNGTSVEEQGIKGIFCGGTEFTRQWYRFAREELLGNNVYITPTYGNTLMGLACGKPFIAEDEFKITYYAPQPRAALEIVDFEDHNKLVGYNETGRVKLYTLTSELFIPGFLERDEAEREPPHEKYPWDGVSSVRPYHVFAKTTTVGVY